MQTVITASLSLTFALGGLAGNVIVLWFLVINTAVDVIYALIDPRIKQG